MNPHRRRAVRGRTPVGRIGENRESWTRVNGHEFILYRRRRDDRDMSEDPDVDELPDHVVEPAPDLPRYVVSWRQPGKSGLASIDLTSLTKQEHAALRAFLIRALDFAEPICEALDTEAQQAWEQGDDSYARIYRPVPQLVVRQRREPEHGEGLPVRSDGTPAGDDGPAIDGPGVHRGGLADTQPDEVVPQDDTAEDDLDPVVRALGGDA